MTDRQLAEAAVNEATEQLQCGKVDVAAVYAQIAQACALLALEAVFGIDLSDPEAVAS